MRCPTCDSPMADVTESWTTFVAAKGAEYMASYVTIWHCDACGLVAGADEETIEWVIDHDGAVSRRDH